MSLTNGLDYRSNLELLVLVKTLSSGRNLHYLLFVKDGVFLSLRLGRAECRVAFECLERLLDMHEVLGSDLGTETRYLARFFCGVLHHLEANSGMVSYFHSCYGRILPCL